MKKMLFSTIALVAFSMTSSAQVTGILTVDANISIECSKKADDYVASLPGSSLLKPEIRKQLRDAYYNGCMDAARKNSQGFKPR